MVPPRCLLALFEATLYFEHNNLQLCYYVKVNSLRLRYNVASKRAREHLGGRYTIYFAVDGIYLVTQNELPPICEL